jgi:hypothetical protein
MELNGSCSHTYLRSVLHGGNVVENFFVPCKTTYSVVTILRCSFDVCLETYSHDVCHMVVTY